MVNEEYLLPMIYEFVIFFIAIFLVIRVGKRYQHKKNDVIKYMFLFILLLGFAVFFAALSRVLRYTGLWEIETGKYIELLSITVCLIGFANIFLLAFELEIFGEGLDHGKNKLFLLIYSIISLIFAIYAIITGIFAVDLTELIWAFIIVISALVYFYMIYSGIKLIKNLKKIENIDQKLEKRSTQVIVLTPIGLLVIFISFFLDRIFGGNFTIFYYFGWFFALIAILTIYTGVLRPQWFVKKFSGKKQDESF